MSKPPSRRAAPNTRPAAAPDAARRDAPPRAGVRGAGALLGALAACVLLRWAAPFAPGTFAWGLDAARDLPAPLALAVAALAAAGFVPGVGGAIERALDSLGRALRRGAVAPLLGALALATLALLARDDLRSVGDSSLRLATVSVRGDLARTLPQAAPLDLALNVALPRALADATPLDAPGALQWVGALVAFAFALAAAAFARALAAEGAALGGAWLALLACGVPVHFAGYDKFGPLLVGLVLSSAGAVRLLRDGRSRTGAAQLVAGFGVALLSHRTGLLAAPGVLLAAGLAARGEPGGRAPVAARVALGACAVAALAAAPWVARVAAGYDRARHLAGAGPTPARLADAANVLFLLAPLWPAAIAAVFVRPRADRAGALLAFAAVAAAPWLAVLASVTGSQGAMRDWDMHAPAALTVALGSALALGLAWNAPGAAGAARLPASPVAAAAGVTLAGALALWALHADEPAQLRRLERQLADSAAWSDEAYSRGRDFLGNREYALEHWDAAIPHWQAALRRAPNSRYFYQVGLSHLRAGRYAAGRPWIDEAHRRDPANPDPFVGYALLALAANDLPGADAMLDSALSRNPRKFDALQMKRMLQEEARR